MRRVRDRQLGLWTSPRRVYVLSSLPRSSSGGPFVPTPGEKIQKRGMSPYLNFPWRKIVYVVYCLSYVLNLKDGGGLDR